MAFNLADYETVETRLEKFWEKYPDGRVITNVIEKENQSIIIRAEIYQTRVAENPIATGIAEEAKSNTGVNKDAWVENCETSAIGRALANGGFGAKGKRPSREEMEKVDRNKNNTPTTDQISDAKEVIDQVPEIKSVAGLKNLHEGAREAGLLNIVFEGKTVHDIISARKKEIENEK